MEITDSDLVRQTLSGQTTSYDCLMKRYQKQVYNLAYRMLGNFEDAGDLTQDTFIRAYSALASFRQDASFITWLYKIASNLCIDHIRSRRSRGALSLDKEIEEGREPSSGTPRSSEPEALSLVHATQEAVQKAVTTLPEDYRLAVVMRHLHGMSVEEIANVLDKPQGTVKTHLFRGRALLKDRLGALLDISPDGK